MEKKYSTITTSEKVSALLQCIADHKGKNPEVLDLSRQSTFAEAMIVITATSIRHAQSLAESIVLFCKQENFEFLRTEGKQTGQWILLDLNDIVISIFQDGVRELYNLEALWKELPKDLPKED